MLKDVRCHPGTQVPESASYDAKHVRLRRKNGWQSQKVWICGQLPESFPLHQMNPVKLRRLVAGEEVCEFRPAYHRRIAMLQVNPKCLPPFRMSDAKLV